MKPFAGIGLPELLLYEDLQELVLQRHDPPSKFLAYASESIARAKINFENLSKLSAEDSFSRGSHEAWIRNIKDCLRACISTSILVAKLTAGYDRKRVKVYFPESEKGPGRRSHDWWVVPEITLLLSDL